MKYQPTLEQVVAKKEEAERLVGEAGQVADEQLALSRPDSHEGIWDLLDREQMIYEIAEHLANGGSKNVSGIAMLMIEEVL